jgi:hypothetical protein
VDHYLDTWEGLTTALAGPSSGGASSRRTDRLGRRDRILDEIVVDELASALEMLAAELLREVAAEQDSPRAAGLIVAAAVLSDSAAGLRVGDKIEDNHTDCDQPLDRPAWP